MFKLTLVAAALAIASAEARQIKFYNACPFTVWGAHFTGATANGTPEGPTGYQINSYATQTINVPDSWTAGRFWARTECDFSKPDVQSCATGSCLGGLECTQPGIPPVTVAEFTLAQNGQDNYDVSNVDGSNLPMTITASGCPTASCPVDLNANCPSPLQVHDSAGNVVACKSACQAFGGDANCCTGPDDKPATCPSSGVQYYSYFKDNCPDSYAFAYDESSGTALWTCSKNADYTITLCPPPAN